MTATHERSLHIAFISSDDDIYAVSNFQKFMERSEVDRYIFIVEQMYICFHM